MKTDEVLTGKQSVERNWKETLKLDKPEFKAYLFTS